MNDRATFLLFGSTEERFEDEHFELFVASFGAEGFDAFVIDRANDFEQPEEHRFRVRQMERRFFERGGSHRLDVEADALAVFAVTVGFERPNLVEGAAKIDRSKDFVLIVFETILIV